jgi:hypothetical protein
MSRPGTKRPSAASATAIHGLERPGVGATLGAGDVQLVRLGLVAGFHRGVCGWLVMCPSSWSVTGNSVVG